MSAELFSPHRIEPLAPEPGASAAAWDEVRRRKGKRLLQTQVAAGVGVVLMVMVGLLPSLDEGGRAAELDVAGRETNQSPAPESPSFLITEADEGADATPPGPDAPAGDSARTAAGTFGDAAPPPQPGTATPTVTPDRAKPPLERSRSSGITFGCFEWCLFARVVPEGESYALSLDLCTAVGTRTHRFHFPTTQEVDLTVTTADSSRETLWSWSRGQHFPAAEHHVDIPAGECMEWTTRWDRADEDGQPLPPGRYRLVGKSLAEEVRPRNTTEATFEIP